MWKLTSLLVYLALCIGARDIRKFTPRKKHIESNLIYNIKISLDIKILEVKGQNKKNRTRPSFLLHQTLQLAI